MRYSVIAFVFSVMIISSCTKPLDINIPQTPSKLAIFTQIIPNQIMMVGVTRSFSALTDITGATGDTMNGGILVRRAFVTLKHNNDVDTLKYLTDGIYGTTKANLIDGDVYELYVYDSTTQQAVSSKAQVKPLVQDSMRIVVTRTAEDTTADISFRITDDPSTEDYYYINIARGGKQNFLNDTTGYFKGLDVSTQLMLVSDKEAVNHIIEREYNSTLMIDTFSVGQSDSLSITIASISREYYLFLDAYKRNKSLFNQIFGEPINYPSNVVNGLGVFTAHLPKFYFIDLREH